jgi:hypothetical protein
MPSDKGIRMIRVIIERSDGGEYESAIKIGLELWVLAARELVVANLVCNLMQLCNETLCGSRSVASSISCIHWQMY